MTTKKKTKVKYIKMFTTGVQIPINGTYLTSVVLPGQMGIVYHYYEFTRIV